MDETEWQLPVFSLDERERRWGRVRGLMADVGVDAIVSFTGSGQHTRDLADVRYLTQLGNNGEHTGVVFPLEGDVVAISYYPGHWPASGWVGDTRPARGPMGRAVGECLREAGLDRARVAVAGLGPGRWSSVRVPDGAAPHVAMVRLQEAFPEATFVGAADILGEARMVKSAEEVEFIRRGVGIAERAAHAMFQTAGVGVFEPLIMGEMLKAAVGAGGGLPMMLGWVSGPFGDAYHRLEQPVHRRLASGDYLSVEIEGRWGGYVGQIDQSITVGQVPAWAEDAHKAAVECFWDVVNALEPGVTFGELREVARGVSRMGKAEGQLILHGRGLGDDGPLVLPGREDPEIEGRAVEEGNVFLVKPVVTWDGKRDVGHVGHSVVVTADGAERLGTAPVEPYYNLA